MVLSRAQFNSDKERRQKLKKTEAQRRVNTAKIKQLNKAGIVGANAAGLSMRSVGPIN